LYYVNEYRFTTGDNVQAFSYQYTSDDLFQRGDEVTVTLSGALSGVSQAIIAVAAGVMMANF